MFHSKLLSLDVHTIFTSSILNEGDFSSVMLNEPQYDFIRIQSAQNISDGAGQFVEEFKKRKSTSASFSDPSTISLSLSSFL